MKRRLSERAWYPYATALCIAAAFYALLTHLGPVGGALKTVWGFFAPVVLGLVLAYVMNPLLRTFQTRVFKGMRSEKLRKAISLVLTFVIVLLIFAAVFAIIIPQLISSITGFIQSLNLNEDTINELLENIDMESIDFDSMLDGAGSFLQSSGKKILGSLMGVGKGIGRFIIGFMLSIYILGEKETLKRGMQKLLRLLMSEQRYQGVEDFFRHADEVLVRYIIYSLLESVIVGVANAIFMVILGMKYVPLVSFVVAVTNLIPTFGPLIGAVIGAFVLVLSNPMHALWFLLFTVVLQIVDGYVIKPKLFGDSLGVSGLWILITIVVGGKMFGVIGMLLAIPIAAILVDLYVNYLIPALQRRKDRKAAAVSTTEPEPVEQTE